LTTLAGFFVGMLTAVMLVPAPRAMAHPDGSFYGLWWHGPQKPVVWHFEDDFPTAGNRRDRVLDAISTWESASGDLTFDKEPDFAATTLNCPQEGNSWIGWPFIDGEGGTLGETRVCKFSEFPNQARSFYVRLDRDEPWHSATSTPPPDEETDLQAIATHELGHATGFGFPTGDVKGHWGVNANGTIDQTELQNLCQTTPIETMCPVYEPGTAYIRSLETHDLHTFSARY
jgi:Matrixin